MDEITFNTSEITKKDIKTLEKVLEETHQYLYNLIKKDIKIYIEEYNTHESKPS